MPSMVCPVGIPTAFKGHCGADTFHLPGGSWGWKIPKGITTSSALPSSVLVGPAPTSAAHLGSAYHIRKGP